MWVVVSGLSSGDEESRGGIYAGKILVYCSKAIGINVTVILSQGDPGKEARVEVDPKLGWPSPTGAKARP